MKLRNILFAVAAAGLLFSSDCGSFAQGFFQPPPPPKPFPFVSPLFGDDMVLQRDKPDTIWGWSEQPGDKVTVQMGDTTATGVAQADRRWEVKIKPPAAGGPYTVKITGRETVELHNVLVGDVWLCTGQSNMLVSLREAKNGDDEVKAANYPQIRFFSVFGHATYNHTGVIGGSWKPVTPDAAARVSAVGYYFAREVQKDINIPIGLIVDAIGGTPAESWTSAAALRPLKDFDIPLDMVDSLAAAKAPEYGYYIQHWYDQYDIGLKGNWSAPDFDDSAWKPVTIPGGFAELGVPDTPVLAYFRKEITLPDPLPTGRSMMFLGVIERMDTVYVNGKEAGGSAWVENPRVYFMRPGMLKPGRNIITIRVMKVKPDGGFMSKPEALHLTVGDKTDIPLAGAWKGQISVDGRPPQPLPVAYQSWPVMPSVLYEGLIKPLAPLSITGALWYQGEENSPRAYEYRKVLPAMIADWRNLFQQGNFPFYIVSLPQYKPRSATPVDGDEWAETREAQAITASSVPNSCLAVTIDTGDPDNIHTKDKLPVGQRLAYCALANFYGKHVVYQGPSLKSIDRRKDSIRLHFAHTDGGLVVKGDKPQEFTIAGDDHKWYWANATIKGNTITVASPSVPNPKEVRYAWQSNPAANLFNGAGLPAAPFRTDTWHEMTQDVRPY